MHELALAESILDAVRTELLAYPGAVPIRVGVRIGVMAAVDIDALRFGFDIAIRDSGFSRLTLDARIIPGTVTCLACGAETPAESTVFDCPRCSSAQTMLSGSDELDLDALEVETDDHDRTDLPEAESPQRKPKNRGQPAPAL
jgi:hydrogenase nickel incorporation protein HypA/HybF